MSKKIKISFALNILLLVMVIFATVSMFTGFKFMKGGDLLSISKFEMFKFFTVDSNILLGIASLVMLIFEGKLLKGKIDKLPTSVYVFKMAATVGVALTFFVTTFYLAPYSVFNFFDFYKNANLFFHFIVPVLSIISFVFIENTNQIHFKHSLFGIVPVIIYAIYYVINVVTHIVDGKVSYDYDFYGFVKGGIESIGVVALIIILASYLFTVLIWGINKKIYKES